MAPNPVFRPISFDEARKWSAWPDRVDGRSAWRKTSRSHSDVNEEYDIGLYARLRDIWDEIKQDYSDRPAIMLGSLFHEKVQRSLLNELTKFPEVYGNVDLKQHLMSSGHQLLLGDIHLGNQLHLSLVTQKLNSLVERTSINTLVELGCGTGVNLFNIFSVNGLSKIVGCDLSRNATRFLTDFWLDLQGPADFYQGDMTSRSLLEQAAPISGSWGLLTVHAVEQLRELSLDWILEICSLPNPPSFVMHLEPLQPVDSSDFSRYCQAYADINLYNNNLLQLLEKASERNKIRILETEFRIWGLVAFNPSSLIVWSPSN